MPKQVQYVDFGYQQARDFFEDVCLPAYRRFEADRNRATAINAAILAWHVHDWLWHEENPGVDTRDQGKRYAQFLESLICKCRELAQVKDVANAGKHRGLGTHGNIEQMGMGPARAVVGRDGVGIRLGDGSTLAARPTLEIRLADGDRVDVYMALQRVIDFWKERLPKSSNPGD